MTLPTFTMRQLVEAGVHFGHHTRRWNPRMAPYLFGVRDNVHVIDLQQTVPLLYRAMTVTRDIAAQGGRVLFVGTKRQAQDAIAEAAKRCGQYYVNRRWLGGMLTNWKTISISIKRLRELDEVMAGEMEGRTKKERLNLAREREKLDLALGGIRDMGGQPDILFIIDTIKEQLAVKEANKLGIPVVAICDSNADTTGVDYPIPGNDDAIRAIRIYCELISGAVLDGIRAEMTASGVDIGESEDTPAEAAENAPADTQSDSPAGDVVAAAMPDAETAAAVVEAEQVAEEEAAASAPDVKSGETPAETETGTTTAS